MHGRGIKAVLILFLILTLLTVSLAHAAVELTTSNSRSDEVDEGDVIRIDTSLVTCDLLTPDEQVAKLQAQEQNGRRYQDAYYRSVAARNAKLQAGLAGVGSLTGGWTEFLETPEQADAIYARIFSDINQRYIVGYYPSNKARDGMRRKIDFEVKGHPEYQIYGRRSYFAPRP